MSAIPAKQKGLLLVLSGGIEAVRGLRKLRESGWRLAVLDGDPTAPGFEYAEERLVVSTYELGPAARAAIELHNRRPIVGVMSIAADVPHTVSHIARTLGLPGLEPGTAKLAMDKLAMKQRFRNQGVPIPWFSEVRSAEELTDLQARMGQAIVLKPVDSRGARGVLLLTPESDLFWAFQHSKACSPTGRVMVEAYVPGPQISSESMIVDGKAYTAGLSDRNYEMLEHTAPYMIENGGDQPSSRRGSIIHRVDSVIEAAAAAIGLRDGVLKGDLVLDEGRRVVVIEVAPRLSGGYFCTDQIPLSTGVDLVELQARVAIGEKPLFKELTAKSWSPTCIRYFFPPQGRLVSIEGFAEMQSQPWVEHAGIFVTEGEVIAPLTDHTRRAGFVLVTGSTRAEAKSRADAAIAAVRFEVETNVGNSFPETGPDAGNTSLTGSKHTSNTSAQSNSALR
ncbi:MAG: biotin carboxylase [Planctomycetota bacterium]|jgi:biotin carboxylase